MHYSGCGDTTVNKPTNPLLSWSLHCRMGQGRKNKEISKMSIRQKAGKDEGVPEEGRYNS